jgi:hypothetical protein
VERIAPDNVIISGQPGILERHSCTDQALLASRGALLDLYLGLDDLDRVGWFYLDSDRLPCEGTYEKLQVRRRWRQHRSRGLGKEASNEAGVQLGGDGDVRKLVGINGRQGSEGEGHAESE